MGTLDPVRGHEQAGKRPLLILSDDRFNSGRAGLIIAAPLTRQDKNIPYHVAIEPPEGGLRAVSYIKCEDIRSIARERLSDRWGEVSSDTMVMVEERLRLLLNL